MEIKRDYKQRGIGKSVLIVDDNAAIRALYLRLLGQNGYKVIEANSGHTALDTFQAKAEEIDVVILDFHIPGMTGVELAASLCLAALLWESAGADPSAMRERLRVFREWAPRGATARIESTEA